MRYLKLFESFDESKIHELCKKYKIIFYTINIDGSIDVSDDGVELWGKGLTKMPLKFNKVNGSFSLTANYLTSLEGSPIEVNKHFFVSNNNLTSFQYAPKIIRGDFYCNGNNIKTFEYFPNHVGGTLVCFGNPIEEVWWLFEDTTNIELLNDFDIFRDEDTDTPSIFIDRLNDFLSMIGKPEVENVSRYINI